MCVRDFLSPPSTICNSLFEVAGGSVRGRDHDRLGRNNQDAFAWRRTDNAIIAVVCDGCSSGPYSEVGARLGGQIMLDSLYAWVPCLCHMPSKAVLEQVRQRLLERLQDLVWAMGGDPLRTIQEHFLFTLVGVVITPQKTVVFTLGDGVLAINGAYRRLTYVDNAPPYLAYGLVPDTVEPRVRDHLAFQVRWEAPTRNVQEILIGTDGVHDLYQAAEQRLPGKTEQVGALGQFWREDRYFANAYGITRRLALINRTVTRYDWEQRRTHRQEGLLVDDTTLVVVRRQPCPGLEGEAR